MGCQAEYTVNLEKKKAEMSKREERLVRERRVLSKKEKRREDSR
jgi:hypothetical protein